VSVVGVWLWLVGGRIGVGMGGGGGTVGEGGVCCGGRGVMGRRVAWN